MPLIRWADEGSDTAFPGGVSFSGWAGEGDDATWVSGVNTVEILDRLDPPPNTPSYEWEGMDGSTVEGALTHVGTSSFRTFFTIRNKRGEVFARVRSLGVSVDRANHRPQPLPRRDDLAAHVVPEPELVAPTGKGERPADAYVWSTAVRQTDCDSLGHLNNTKYAAYAEEALGFGCHNGGFSGEGAALADAPIATLHVEYMVELLPYTDVHIAVWWDATQRAFIAEFRSGEGGAEPGGGTLSAVVVMGVREAAPAVGAKL